MSEQQIRLNKTDLAAIEHETALLVGEIPTIETLVSEGYSENQRLNMALDWIAGVFRVVTLFTAEMIQGAAALTIAAVFAVLEYYRVMHGALALGQEDAQAALIAFAVVTANIVHPIYSLRQLRGQSQLEIVKMTGRGYVASFWRRLTGKPVSETVDLYYNPTLHLAAAVITWSTVILAVYDILNPLLTAVFTNTLSRPFPLALMELVMGLGLSISGVFFLQSAAHEIGVRTLTDQPTRLVNMLEQRRAEHAEQVVQVREEVRARYITAKLAEQERKVSPFGATAPMQAAPDAMRMNGHVNGNGGGKTAPN